MANHPARFLVFEMKPEFRVGEDAGELHEVIGVVAVGAAGLVGSLPPGHVFSVFDQI